MKVKFNKDQTVYDADGAVDVQFKSGETYTLTKPSADRWIRRGVAELVKKPSKKETASITPAETAVIEPGEAKAADPKD